MPGRDPKSANTARKVVRQRIARKPARASRRTTRQVAVEAENVSTVLTQAARSGLLGAKDARIAGRISSRLIDKAKARTGLRTDSALIEFALANLALDDGFPEMVEALRGTVDPALDLEF
jgi:hypothetical protein